MLIFIIDLLLISGIIFFVSKWAYKAWLKADVKAKDDELDILEENAELVQEAKKEHKNVKEKKDAITKFKNQ